MVANLGIYLLNEVVYEMFHNMLIVPSFNIRLYAL